ncbi:MAG: hypothetical protein BRC28_00530 [Nanohaloarchaea archaeon SW_4_43_9]|nr:MAG: hypothetical protein BRC28_00530 [Nanohaloarchaea archaeon SW_4_43_9]
MKEHAKKALKHDVELLGKTVPTVAVLALFLIGSGSAALLTNFGTVSGDAEVEQAVVLNGGSDFSFDTNQVAGETEIETRTLQSNANVSTQIGFNTTCSNSTDGYSSSIEGVSADFGETSGCTGIETDYVEYFDDAGHDFSRGYSYDAAEITVDSDNTGDSNTYGTIQKAVNNAAEDDVIVVTNGIYDEDVDVTKSVTLVADNPRGATADGFDIVASDVTVKGFEIKDGFKAENSGNFVGVRVNNDGDNAVITHNHIHDISGSEATKGVQVFRGDKATVRDNHIEGIESTGSGAYGVLVQHNSDDTTVSQNTVEGVNGVWAFGVDVDDAATGDGTTGSPSNALVEYNHIGTVTGDSYLGTAVGVEAASSPVDVQNNNMLTASDIESKSDVTVNADNNWFGTDGITLDQQDSSTIDASWADADTTVAANTDDEFGIVNEFAINLKPDSYSLTTSILPANGETSS